MSGALNEETLGPESRIKKSEFIRIITDALYSLKYDKVGNLLETDSGIPLLSPIVKLFLKQVTKGEWDNSIATLERSQLFEETTVRSASFLLQEQKFLDFLKADNVTAALSTLREKLVPLGVNMKRVHELASKLTSGFGQDTESLNSRLEVVEKLQRVLPHGVIIPPKRLEDLLEESLYTQLYRCDYHNVLDSDMSLLSDHNCWVHKIPSKTVQILKEHTDQVWFLEFSHNGKYLASASKDKSAIIWEMGAEGKFLQKHRLMGHDREVVTVLWSPDDGQVITCGENEVIRRWDVNSGECVHLYEIDGVRSVSCGWFHDGSGIIGAMTDRSICLWKLDESVLEHVLGSREPKLSDVAMTSDGKWLVSLSKLDQISLFDRETKITMPITEEDMITSFWLSKDSRYPNLLINLCNEKISHWVLRDEPIREEELTGHKRTRFIIRSCIGGYHQSFIASGSEDSQIYIWNGSQPDEPCRVLQGHSGAVNCVSWNPTDLHMLASASDDGTVRIWGLDNELK